MRRLLLKKDPKYPSHSLLAGCWDYPARRRKSTGSKNRMDILNSKDGVLHSDMPLLTSSHQYHL